jgi:pimeloyl-ACP methyl ester carboxylesterase
LDSGLGPLFWVAVALTAAVCAYVFLATKYFTLETSPDEIHFVQAADGARLALHRYRPPAPLYREPVILCHGLAMNRFLFDFGGDPSLARFLRDHGFDVWVVEYRGAGMSSSPRLFDGRKMNWTLDDIVHRDVTAFVNAVSRAAGGAPVHWIGHSTGGVVILCHLGLYPHVPVASVVALGTPAQFDRLKGFAWLHPGRFLLQRFRVLRIELLSQLVAAGWLTFRLWPVRTILRALMNPANVSRRLLRCALVNLLTNPLCPLVLQYSAWMRTGRALSVDGTVDYFEGLGRIHTPVLLLCGAADPAAPPAAARWLYDRLAGQPRQLLIASRDNGTRQDYGHGDLLLGRHAVEEVFPLVRRWLVERSTSLPLDGPAAGKTMETWREHPVGEHVPASESAR